MSDNLLTIQGLRASVEGKPILKGLDLAINQGEVHVLMGPNGAGKSTLANVILGDPRYAVEAGTILFEGEDIGSLRTDERARRGIFLSFQAPQEIAGVTLESFLRTAREAQTGQNVKLVPFRRELRERMAELNMDAEWAGRYLNVGFSGGEKKKSEILQMSMLKPKLAILDETDSGLDVDAVKTISESVARQHDAGNAVLIITHITRILDRLPISRVHVMADGRIVRSGDASLVEEINRDGFAPVLSA